MTDTRVTPLLVLGARGACDHRSFLAGALPDITGPERANLEARVRALPRHTAPGCPLEHGALDLWLEHAEGVLVVAPFTLMFQDPGRVWLLEARLGARPTPIDTGRLGIALSDRVRDLAPPGATCHVWLEGFWETGGLSLIDAPRFVVTRHHEDPPRLAHVLRILCSEDDL